MLCEGKPLQRKVDYQTITTIVHRSRTENLKDGRKIFEMISRMFCERTLLKVKRFDKDI